MDTDNRELYRIISGFPKYCISNRGRVMNILSGKYLSRVCAGERKSYKSFIWKYKV